MNATNKDGHVWTGEREGIWWNYLDAGGHEYQSKESPVYRIAMNNATFRMYQTWRGNKMVIVPLP